MSKRRGGTRIWFGFGGIPVLAAILLAGGVARGEARADRPRISVAPVAGEHATPELKEKVGQSLAEGLIASGADVAPAPADAAYMLRGRVEVEGRSYTLHLEMVDRKTGAVVASREDRCEICTEAEAFETANTAASTLKAIVFKRTGGPQALATTAPAAPAPASVAAAAPPGTAGSNLQIEATAASPRARHRGLGWTGVAGGIVSAGVGAFLISIDGQRDLLHVANAPLPQRVPDPLGGNRAGDVRRGGGCGRGAGDRGEDVSVLRADRLSTLSKVVSLFGRISFNSYVR